MKKMSKSLTIATSSFELITFLFTIISFSFYWVASSDIDYLGFNMFAKFAEEIVNLKGYNLIMLISTIVILVVSILGLIISILKMYKFSIDNRTNKVYNNPMFNKINNILSLILFPFVAYILLNGIPNYSPEVENFWAYRLLLFFPFILTLITLAFTTINEPNEKISENIKQDENNYYNYSSERSIFFEKMYSILFFSLIFLFFLTGYIDNAANISTTYMVAFGLIILGILLSVFIIILPNKTIQKTDLFNYVRLLLSISLVVILPLISDNVFTNLKIKYLSYILNLVNILFSIYYIKNLKIRFYSSWSIAILTIIYSLIIV